MFRWRIFEFLLCIYYNSISFPPITHRENWNIPNVWIKSKYSVIWSSLFDRYNCCLIQIFWYFLVLKTLHYSLNYPIVQKYSIFQILLSSNLSSEHLVLFVDIIYLSNSLKEFQQKHLEIPIINLTLFNQS